MFNLIIGALIIEFAVVMSNPCLDAPKLHDLERRYTSYKADPINEGYVCDVFEIPPEGKWYRTDGINMPTTAPRSPACGTVYAIWLGDPLPEAGQENIPVDRKACVLGLFGSCETEVQIKIQRCFDGTFVYFLFPMRTCDTAYCFGTGTQDTPPTYDPGTTSVNHQFYHHTSPEHFLGKFELHQFKCHFTPHENLNIFYQVTWYINDNSFISKTVKKEKLDEILLNEQSITEIGVDIKCSVRPKYRTDGTPGVFRVSSKLYFGIKLHTTEVNLPRDGTATVTATLNIPFGCFLNDDNELQEGCFLTIGMNHPQLDENGECDSSGNGDIVGGNTKCRKVIDRINWEQQHALTIKWKDGSNYRLDQTEFLLEFIVFRNPPESIWNRHRRLQPVKVKVYEQNPNTQTKAKTCRITNDPHMYTFDNRAFEHHITGVFVLYRDMKNTVYEVQHQSVICNNPYHCTCGVAVRSGADLFKIDYCNGKRMIEYVTCHEKRLEVKRIRDTSYLVTLPTGTSIQINIENIYNTKYLSAFISPSIYDWHNTRGLCGNISDHCEDDFRDPTGTPTGDAGSNLACTAPRFTPTRFINAWSVQDDANLFKIGRDNELPPSLTTSAYCKCPSNDDIETDTDNKDFACSASSTLDCEIQHESDPFGAEKCQKLLDHRIKRSLEYPFKTAELKRRKKRSIREIQPEEVNMSQEEAEHFCLSFMEGSPVFNACKDIPEVKVDDYLEICALDISLTNTLSWANQTLEAFKTSCMKELRMNSTLKIPGSNGTQSVAKIIKDTICPGNPMCNNNGDCSQGKCRCFDGFISPDCSVDLGMPPDLISVRGDGICDKYEIPCNVSFVVAEEIYSTDNLTCTINTFQIDANGTYTLTDKYSIKAKYESLVEVLCPLKPTRVKRSSNYASDEDNFASAFQISVSYDGTLFSDNVEMLVYDSRCQAIVNTTDRIYFRIIDGYCKLDDKCIPEGTYSLNNLCLICDTNVSKYSWTKVTDTHECVPVVNESYNSNEYQTVILATCIPLVTILILAVVIGLVKSYKQKRSKIAGSQDFGTICSTGNIPPTYNGRS